MPYNVVPANQPLSPIAFTQYAKQSDPGPYPLPDPKTAKFEGPNGGPDHHLLVLQQGTCELYEMGRAYYTDGKWTAVVGAKWNTITGTPRPDNITSADAAGTPILPGIITCADVTSGIIQHAINVVIPEPTYYGYISPATHWNDEYTNPNDMPMGARLRIKESISLASLTGQALIIATALQRYGGIVKDVGQTGFSLEGETGTCWNAKDLAQLDNIPVSDLEVLNTGAVQIPYSKGKLTMKEIRDPEHFFETAKHLTNEFFRTHQQVEGRALADRADEGQYLQGVRDAQKHE